MTNSLTFDVLIASGAVIGNLVAACNGGLDRAQGGEA